MRYTRTKFSFAAWRSAILLLLIANHAQAEPAFEERFEGPDVSWRQAGGDAQIRILGHARTLKQFHAGRSSEKLHLATGNGSQVLFRHAIRSATVISELSVTVWVRSDRPGIRVAARVVLPRTEDPRTGKPLATIVWGTESVRMNQWQQLRLEELPKKLVQQVRVLRQEVGPHVDPREAYIDQILLNVYGGRGETTVWTDDLELTGVVTATRESMASGFQPRGAARLADSRHNVVSGRRRPVHEVRFEGEVLLVDDRPFLPRILTHQGEPLAMVRDLGFNALRVDRLPAPEMFAEARQLGLWFICPPPSMAQLQEDRFAVELDRVLVWDLGSQLASVDLEPTRAWATAVGRHADLARRPLLVGALEDLADYSRIADVLLIGRDALFSSLELADIIQWLGQQRRLARSGTPIWSQIQTQADPRLEQQWQTLSGGSNTLGGVSYRQLQQLVSLNLRAGSHGLLFTSHGPLAAPDAVTRQRALALEQINLYLDLIEPWAAAGRFVTPATSTKQLQTATRVQASVLQIERARLLIPVAWGPGAQFVAPILAPTLDHKALAFVVPGVPETNEAYALSLVGLQPIRRKRVAGGVRVSLDEPGIAAMVLMTQDAMVVSQLSQRAARSARRAATLQRELAVRQLEITENVERQLADRIGRLPQNAKRLAGARGNIAQCDGLIASGDWPRAFVQAGRALRAIGRVDRDRWQQYAQRGDSPVATPFGVHLATLPQHFALIEEAASGRLGPELLRGGDFDDLSKLVSEGWRHFQHRTPNVSTEVALSPIAAGSHNFCLQLKATTQAAENPPRFIATAPVWVSTPPIDVHTGARVKIEGWVRVTKPITGSIDGLMVFDSWTGEALALRIGQTEDWQKFTLIRAAPPSVVPPSVVPRPGVSSPGILKLTFALTGLGEAQIDAVSVRMLEPVLEARVP